MPLLADVRSGCSRWLSALIAKPVRTADGSAPPLPLTSPEMPQTVRRPPPKALFDVALSSCAEHTAKCISRSKRTDDAKHRV